MDEDLKGSPCVVDLDDDGCFEILVASRAGRVYAWKCDGTGYRDSTGNFRNVSATISGAIVAGDVDDDGLPEVVFGTVQPPKLFVLRNTQGLEDGWPLLLAHGIETTPSLADLDGDGFREILYGGSDGNVYAFRHDGTGYLDSTGVFVYVGGVFRSSPVVADFDDDGDPEVAVTAADETVRLFEADASPVPGWPFRSIETMLSTPAWGDLDGDGDGELVVAGFDGFVRAWDFPGPAAGAAWPMYQVDRFRSGSLDYSLPPPPVGSPGPAAAPRATALTGVAPNPFNPRVEISFDLAADGDAELEVFDVRGTLIATLVHGAQEAGRHVAAWDGRDRSGRPVASGVYFVRLLAGDSQSARKMVLLR
jgi:hypothetical protein